MFAANEFHEHFKSHPPRNMVMLTVIKKFCSMGSLFTQDKSCTGYPLTLTTNHEQRFEQIVTVPKEKSPPNNFENKILMRRMFKQIDNSAMSPVVWDC